jgi:hypothetical protein
MLTPAANTFNYVRATIRADVSDGSGSTVGFTQICQFAIKETILEGQMGFWTYCSQTET